MKLDRLFKLAKKVAPVVILYGPQIIDTVKAVKKAAKGKANP